MADEDNSEKQENPNGKMELVQSIVNLAKLNKASKISVLEVGTMPLDNKSRPEDQNEGQNAASERFQRKKLGKEEDLDPVALAELGARRGSRFSADGTPLFLRAFLESANPLLNFQFCFKDSHLQPLENECDRRFVGKKVRYEMFEGDFRPPGAFKQATMPEGNRYRISDLYHLTTEAEAGLFIGIQPGWRVPVITDANPHQDGLLDHRKAVYLPFSEDKNLIMELPCSQSGLFFTSQIISGGELCVAFDKTLHKYWVLTTNQVYTPSKYARNQNWNLQMALDLESSDETCWRRSIENQAYCDRVLDLLTRLGNNAEIIIRVAPTTQFFALLSHEDSDKKHPSQARLDNYFRDEIMNSKGRIRHYYYEKEALVYGFYEEGQWQFGLKDRSKNNGYAIRMENLTDLYVNIAFANFPL